MELTAENLKAYPDGCLTETVRRTIAPVCDGMTYKEVANQMDTSEQVIKNRIQFIFRKIEIRNKAEFVSRILRFSYEHGASAVLQGRSVDLGKFIGQFGAPSILETGALYLDSMVQRRAARGNRRRGRCSPRHAQVRRS